MPGEVHLVETPQDDVVHFHGVGGCEGGPGEDRVREVLTKYKFQIGIFLGLENGI